MCSLDANSCRYRRIALFSLIELFIYTTPHENKYIADRKLTRGLAPLPPESATDRVCPYYYICSDATSIGGDYDSGRKLVASTNRPPPNTKCVCGSVPRNNSNNVYTKRDGLGGGCRSCLRGGRCTSRVRFYYCYDTNTRDVAYYTARRARTWRSFRIYFNVFFVFSVQTRRWSSNSGADTAAAAAADVRLCAYAAAARCKCPAGDCNGWAWGQLAGRGDAAK